MYRIANFELVLKLDAKFYFLRPTAQSLFEGGLYAQSVVLSNASYVIVATKMDVATLTIRDNSVAYLENMRGSISSMEGSDGSGSLIISTSSLVKLSNDNNIINVSSIQLIGRTTISFDAVTIDDRFKFRPGEKGEPANITLQVNQATFQGNISIIPGDILAQGNSSEVTITDSLSVTGNFRVTAGAKIYLNGSLSAGIAVALNNSDFFLQSGKIVAPTVQLMSGGDFAVMGDAVITGDVVVNSGGTLLAYHDLNISGSYTQHNGSTFVAMLNGESHTVRVKEAITISNEGYLLYLAPYPNLTASSTYVIMETMDKVHGAFNNTPFRFGGYGSEFPVEVDYDENSIYVIVSPSPTSFFGLSILAWVVVFTGIFAVLFLGTLGVLLVHRRRVQQKNGFALLPSSEPTTN